MRPLFLMTDPAHFAVTYVINPWMTPGRWNKDARHNSQVARAAWNHLTTAFRALDADIEILDGVAGLPDLVFPANAAIVLDGRALLSRFRFPERRGEEAVFATAFHGLKKRRLLKEIGLFPDGVIQEGAGDCLWDSTRQFFWAGYGQRSEHSSLPIIESFFNQSVIGLELTTPKFYHLDVCFRPLPGGEILYYPKAFSAESIRRIKKRVPPELLIEASDEEANGFCLNAVSVGHRIVTAKSSARLNRLLQARGYTCTQVDLSPFIMAGGGAFCMTLNLAAHSESGPGARRRRAQLKTPLSQPAAL